MKKFIHLFMLCFFCALQMPVFADEGGLLLTPEERAWIQKNPVLKVGNELDWPPFDYSVDGEPLGYTIDLVRLLAKKLGMQVEFVNGHSWAVLMDMLRKGDIHIMPAIYTSEERKQFLDFTPGYYSQPSVIVVKKTNKDIVDVTSLSGKKVAGVKGFAVTDTLAEKYKDITVLEFATVTECLKAVSIGKVDAYIDSVGLVAYTLENNFIPNVKVIGNLEIFEFSNPPMHMAALKENAVLIQMLSKALAEVTRAEKNELSQKWLEFSSYEKRMVFTEEQIEWIKKHPVVTVGLDPSYAPYSFLSEEGQHVGIAKDFLEIISKKIGVKFIIKANLSWAEIIQQGKEQKIDVIAPIVLTEQRKEYLNFSPVYIPTPMVIVTQSNKVNIKKPEDLKGLKIALVKNYWSAQEVVERNHGIEEVWVDTVLDALRLVSTDDVDAYVGVMGVVTHLIREQGMSNLKIASAYYDNNDGQRFAIRSDWPELTVLITEALDDISLQQRKEIYDRWISVAQDDSFDYVFFFQVLAIFLLILVLMLFYNRKLANEIVQRKKVEQVLQQTNTSLLESQGVAERANKAKSEFISNMSHELRTPLTAIIGFSDVMVDDAALSEPHRAKLKHIKHAGEYLVQLIDDILDISMIESGNLKLHIEKLSVKQLLEECLHFISPQASAKHIQSEVRLEHKHDFIQADKLRMKQVLLNLLSNAIKYNHEGGQIVITVCDEASGYLKIIVDDTGIGIDAEQIEKVFADYERIGAERTEVAGRGMGLAIAKKLMENMGGRIGVSSIKGKGSSFWIIIPLWPATT